MSSVVKRHSCRACGGELRLIQDFGPLPMMGVFRSLHEHVPLYPLSLVACNSCQLLQLGHTVDPGETFRDGFGYRSATNESMVRHLKELAEHLYRLKGTGPILDIACNDNTFLKLMPGNDLKIGIDPVGEEAEGITTIKSFFSREAYGDRPKAGLITAFAVLYDLDDPVHFLKEVAECLADDGILALEVGDGLSLLSGTYDVICHEHLTFFGVAHIQDMAIKAGLTLVHSTQTTTNGGSILTILRKNSSSTLAVMDSKYTEKNVNSLSIRIPKWAHDLHIEGEKLGNMVGLAASTKGNFTLQVAKLTDYVTRVVDRGVHKVGKVIPGTQIPIIREEQFLEEAPENMLALAWHFWPSMRERYAKILTNRTRVLFPLPTPKVLGIEKF